MGNEKTKSLKQPAKTEFTTNRFSQAAASGQAAVFVELKPCPW